MAQKAGYLNNDFQIFYLTNAEERDFQSHYHDFHKLLIFESGNVSYYIEGSTYELQPNDIVLVPAGEVHRPVIHSSKPYHRLIVYLSPAFFDRYLKQGIDLAHCFTLCSRCHSHVLRIHHLRENRLYPILRELIFSAQNNDSALDAAVGCTCTAPDKAEAFPKILPTGTETAACTSTVSTSTDTRVPDRTLPVHSKIESCGSAFPVSPGTEASGCTLPVRKEATDSIYNIYRTSVLLQFLILLNGLSDGADITFPAASGTNRQILQVLEYVNSHLHEELSIDRIAKACYLNRSYLMHLFRRETGYTLGSYITEKRLFSARTLIQSGTPVTNACFQSGFSSYPAFYRAYRKKFGEAPRASHS